MQLEQQVPILPEVEETHPRDFDMELEEGSAARGIAHAMVFCLVFWVVLIWGLV
jgi:hypothetical protein